MVKCSELFIKKTQNVKVHYKGKTLQVGPFWDSIPFGINIALTQLKSELSSGQDWSNDKYISARNGPAPLTN